MSKNKVANRIADTLGLTEEFTRSEIAGINRIYRGQGTTYNKALTVCRLIGVSPDGNVGYVERAMRRPTKRTMRPLTGVIVGYPFAA